MLGCAFEPWGCDWSSGAFAELKQLITRQVPEGDRRDKALNRIAILDPAKASWTQQQEEKVWTDLARSSPSAEVFIKNFTVKLKEMGCDANLGPYVIHGFLFNPISPSVQETLAAAFLDGKDCPSASALGEPDRLLLQFILTNTKLRQVEAQVATCISREFSAPEANPLRTHMPLVATEATPEQLADRSFATDEEVAAFEAIASRMDQCNQNYLAQLSAISSPLQPAVSALYAKLANDFVLLKNRKITWGEYNTERQAFAMDLQSQLMADLQRRSQGNVNR